MLGKSHSDDEKRSVFAREPVCFYKVAGKRIPGRKGHGECGKIRELAIWVHLGCVGGALSKAPGARSEAVTTAGWAEEGGGLGCAITGLDPRA